MENNIIEINRIYNNILDILNQILIGETKVKNALTASLLCSPNSKILLTGNTGVGKTTLANFLYNSFNSERISITSDLIPEELLSILKNSSTIEFLHLDEFNRASGKVLAAFNELLAEKQITIKGETLNFKDFYVLATQNEADIAGIFTVPQSVYDRFDLNLYFGTLSEEDKKRLLFDFIPNPNLTLKRENLKTCQEIVANFQLSEEDKNLLMQVFNIIDAMTINSEPLFASSNIRAHKFAIKLAKLHALKEERDYILPSDLADYISYLYMHRVNTRITELSSLDLQNYFNAAENQILELKKKRRGR